MPRIAHLARAPQLLAFVCLLALAPVVQSSAQPASEPHRGIFFSKKTSIPHPLPTFSDLRSQLPSPLYDEAPSRVAMYWKAWELAFHNFCEPTSGSHFVSPYIDAAFNENTFLWDTCFMAMFCDLAHPLVPGIASLDNFYARQYPDGEIGREIVRATGEDWEPWRNTEKTPLVSRWGFDGPFLRDHPVNQPVSYLGRPAPATPPFLTLDTLDNPIPAWAELESYRLTGDFDRIRQVYPPLVAYYRALQTYLRQGNGLYLTDWGSMDNSPRNGLLTGGGTAVDTSAQMVLFARSLSTMAAMLGNRSEAGKFTKEADDLSSTLNRLMWDPERRFYYDLTLDGLRVPIKTVAGFWPLLAHVADKDQAGALAAELDNPKTFRRPGGIPSLAADQGGYAPHGSYWRGSVWVPTTVMAIRGLEAYGFDDQARTIALHSLDVMGEVFARTGTLWENYAPEDVKPGEPAKNDFVGWTGIGPIAWFIEYEIGLRPDAATNALVWNLTSTQRVGCERYRFNSHVVSLIAAPAETQGGVRRISIQSDGPFTLHLRSHGQEKAFEIRTGDQTIEL